MSETYKAIEVTSDPSSTMQLAISDLRAQLSLANNAQRGLDQFQRLFAQVVAAATENPPSGDPQKRLFFPNGIDLIDATVKIDLKDGFMVQLKLQGPIKT